MDHRSLELMDDIVLDQRGSNSASNKSSTSKGHKDKIKSCNGINPHKPRQHLKVELQNLSITEELERQLYDTLKFIYGLNFKLKDESEVENKKSNIGREYWLERGNLCIKGVMDYSSKENATKSQEQITREFATSKLESYSFHPVHCLEALSHTKGHMGKALEILFIKYYDVENLKRPNIDIDENELMERRAEEKLALESIYGNAFKEKIKNHIWSIKLKLDYLFEKPGDDNASKKITRKPKKQDKDVCRLFLHGKCRFGAKCKFLHQQPESPKTNVEATSNDSLRTFTLEIRFPEGSKYPYEPPFFYFLKEDSTLPRLKCLRIARRLHDEAINLCSDGTPSIFSIISLIENESEMKAYLEQSKEVFLDKNDTLFYSPENSNENDGTLPASHYELGYTNKRNGSDRVSWETIVKTDDTIQRRFFEKQNTASYQKMRNLRRKLPAWAKQEEILETIHENSVTIISGETGCGKSTQVPQFLLDDWILRRSEEAKEHVEIICTQPRRISAIGVAERVASERDERVGNVVGYHIRLENKLSSSTRLTFCTTGILLQRLSKDPDLKSVTHVVIDEVHERSAESDFLLMLLRRLLKRRTDLKVILMSATLKADVFSQYFTKAPVLNIPGKTFPVEKIFLEEVLSRANYILEENSKFTRKIKGGWEHLEVELESADIDSLATVSPKDSILDEHLTLAQLIGRYPGYENLVYKSLYVMDHEKINFELIEKVLEWIVDGDHDYPRAGSILVFLPGFAEITTLKDSLSVSKIFSPKNGKYMIIPLHSALSSEEQSLVFKKPKEGVRKIVLSTNLAETSITIEDCVFVVDVGKMKELGFNSNQNMESLEMRWVSRANAMQRAGRAGRVMPGVAIHLYTSHRFKHHFQAQPVPEILRIPLEPLLLRIQVMNTGKRMNLFETLGDVLEAPSKESISGAVKRLQDLGAFDISNNLTPLGHHLAALPVDVRIGKIILFGAIFCCLDSALTIAAALSHKSPFMASFDKKYAVDAKKREFAVANSDQLTVLRAYKKWLEVCSRGGHHAELVFANENFLSLRVLRTLADIKYQFLELLVSIGFVPINMQRKQAGVDRILEWTGNELNANNENYKLLQGLLCAALYPNVVKVFTPEKSFEARSVGAVPRQPKAEELRFQTMQDGFVSIHPSSINFTVGHFNSPYLVFQEKMKTSKIFIKEVSMVPVLAFILFSGCGLNIELHNGIFLLSLEDGWIMFKVDSYAVAQLLQRIRIELAKLLEEKMKDPLLNLLNHQQGKRIIQTIVNLVTRT